MQLNESLFDTVVLYKFLRLLTTPFTEWEAYKLGVIDADGKVIKSHKIRTAAERNSFTKFDVLVRNLKRIIEKIPGGKSRLATYAAGLYLIKEQSNAFIYEDEDIAYESFMDFFDQVIEDQKFMENSSYLIEQATNSGAMPEYEELVDEDAPANSVAGGGVAGLTAATGGPVIRPESKKKKKLESFKNKVAKKS